MAESAGSIPYWKKGLKGRRNDQPLLFSELRFVALVQIAVWFPTAAFWRSIADYPSDLVRAVTHSSAGWQPAIAHVVKSTGLGTARIPNPCRQMECAKQPIFHARCGSRLRAQVYPSAVISFWSMNPPATARGMFSPRFAGSSEFVRGASSK